MDTVRRYAYLAIPLNLLTCYTLTMYCIYVILMKSHFLANCLSLSHTHTHIMCICRQHFYKQLKKDLLQGKLKVGTLGKAAKLTALMAQIDKGDYRVGIQYNHKVLCQADNDNMDGRIRREHQKLAGTSNEIATEKFLEDAATLDLYGVELYHVLDGHRVPKIIGVGPENVQIYSSSMELEKRCVCVCVCVCVSERKQVKSRLCCTRCYTHTSFDLGSVESVFFEIPVTLTLTSL